MQRAPVDAGSGRIVGALLPTILLLLPLWLAYVFGDPPVVKHLPLLLIPICALGVFRLYRRDRLFLWSPMTWFLIACIVYYGVGPLVLVHGDAETITYIQSYYFADEAMIARTNALNTLGIALVCLTFEAVILAMVSVGGTRRPAAPVDPESYAAPLYFLFVGVGYSAMASVFALRSMYGEGYIMPGILHTLAEFSKLALLVAVYRFVRGHRFSLWLVLLSLGVEVVVAVASLMKQNVLEVMLMAFLGTYLARPSLKWLLLAAPAAGAAYWIMAPVFGAARYLWGGDATMLETLRIVAEEFQNQSVGGTKEGDMSWWARLCYAPAQIFAMEMYDMDMKGNTFESIVTTVVPRIFWPDKPIITQGHEFSYLVKGAEGGGGSGPGAFSEGYWNAGWAGFLFVTISLGLMHAVLTWFNLARFRQGDLRWLPVAFVSVKAAYRVDDWFVATVFGALPMMLASGVLVFSVAGLLHWGSGGRIAVGPGKRYGPTMRELRRH